MFSRNISLLIGLLAFTTLPSAAFAETFVSVESDPPGAAFVLEGPNNVTYIDGVTPMNITDVPTQQVIVHYTDIPGCITPRPQARVVSPMLPIKFFGRYDCSGPAPKPVVEQPETDDMHGRAALKLSPHQMEVLPGGEVRYTLAVHNLSKTTQHAFDVSFQFDPSEMSVKSTLPSGGRLDGSGLAVWHVPALYAGQTWSISFPVTIDDDIQQGQRLFVSSRVSSPDLVADASDQLSTRVMVGTPIIPATGSRYDIAFLLLSLLSGFSLVVLHSRKVRF